MKRSLAHLPKRKKDELKRVVGIVREMVPSVEMMILFGSCEETPRAREAGFVRRGSRDLGYQSPGVNRN
ncbi:MAG: hypothetical protein GY847_19950 [Proteobacteria bacterium]|nr:hypothetical protein [Pseudomonadota bacterium]